MWIDVVCNEGKICMNCGFGEYVGVPSYDEWSDMECSALECNNCHAKTGWFYTVRHPPTPPLRPRGSVSPPLPPPP